MCRRIRHRQSARFFCLFRLQHVDWLCLIKVDAAGTHFESKGDHKIPSCSGTDFDPDVVDAFLTTFSRGEMEVPFVSV